MKIEKRLTLIIILIVICLAALAFGQRNCHAMGSAPTNTADTIQAAATQRSMAEAQRQVGMPSIVNFQQRKLMKTVYELCDKEDLICYAYLKSDYTGKLILLGKCIGYGIPFSAQFTNPNKIVKDPYRYQSGGKLLAQADPNGLFMPTASSATWLMMIDPKTKKPRPVYIEPEIVVSPFPLM